jgi:hypothetical protein
MGVSQAEKPEVGKEGIGPAMMFGTSSAPSFAQAFPENASLPHPDPSVQSGERPVMAVLEVFKPAAQGLIQVVDDLSQTRSEGPLRLRGSCL